MKRCGSKILNKQYSFVNIDLDSLTKNVNKNEDNRIISECIGNDIKIDLKEKIGAGTFGYIYSALYTDNITGFKKEVAVKKMVGKVTSNNAKFHNSSSVLEDFEYEVKYSIDMANKRIGPIIYKAFYITDDNVIEEEPNYFIKYLVLYIIMEKFEYSLDSFLHSGSSTLQKETAVKMSMDLLKDQIYNSGLYCIDIKPGNYVVNQGNDGDDPVVKMIDFGADYCKNNVKELRSNNCILDYKKDTLYVYCLLQMYEMLVPKRFSYVILSDPVFTEYFVNNRVSNKDIIIQVYKEGADQEGDQCHLVWFYGNEMYRYYYKSLKIDLKDDLYSNILENKEEEEDKLANNMYVILYHYIDEDIKRSSTKRSSTKRSSKRSSLKRISKLTPNKIEKIRSKIRSDLISKRRNLGV